MPNDQPLTKNSYNVSEAAKIIGVSRTTIYALINQGYLTARYLRLGQPGLRIPADSIQDYLATQTYEPGA
jgi:excisionase family DNA binding protein